MRSTHTHVELEVTGALYDEVREKLEAAGYEHAFGRDGEIDMHGIALIRQRQADVSPALAGGNG